jgi:sugar porter (SP) family MFS transporter
MAVPVFTASGGPTLDAQTRSGYLFLIIFVAAMGGLLFGYDWVVIGGAAKFYEAAFQLRDTAQAVDATSWQKTLGSLLSPTGWAQSCALIGCLLGALVSGAASDKFGRKPILIAAALNFLLSSVGIALAGSFNAFVLWRILGGVSIGLASGVSPMYIAEVAPAKRRGMLVAINQLTIVIGILLAQVVNMLIAREVPAHLALESAQLSAAQFQELGQTWNATHGWRWMFGACAVPSFLFLIGALIVPESPRWLAKAGHERKALKILEKIGGREYAEAGLKDIHESLVGSRAGVRIAELFSPKVFGVVCFGVAMATLVQWCGINVIFNYAEKIFAGAGFKTNTALMVMAGTGAVNLIFTFVALFTVDKWGRRPLMLFGFLSLTSLFLVLGWCYSANAGVAAADAPVPPYVFLALVLTSIGCYAMSLAPVTWVLIAEMFPNRVRGVAMSIVVGALWLANFVLTYTFPILKEKFGISGTFWLYAAICLAGFALLFFKLKETKGRTLEQLEND